MSPRSLASWAALVLSVAAAVGLAVNLAVERGTTLLKRTVHDSVRTALAADAQDFALQRDRIAAHETAAFVQAEMPKVPAFADRNALLEHSLKAAAGKEGLYCEFGVYKGETVNFIAARTPHTIHGFDSFEGLPETWRTGFEEGTFVLSNLPEVRPNVKLHKGWFDQSLPVWAKDHPGPLAFGHMDADLYSSTKCVLDILGDRVGPGTVLQFDEYFNYPGWKEGEYKAFTEFVAARGVKFEYIGYAAGGNAQQVAVRILEVGPRKDK
jgi:hypothetical protein